MTNAEARFNNSLRPRKPEGSLGRTAQDGHLDSHIAPELWEPCWRHFLLYTWYTISFTTLAVFIQELHLKSLCMGMANRKAAKRLSRPIQWPTTESDRQPKTLCWWMLKPLKREYAGWSTRTRSQFSHSNSRVSRLCPRLYTRTRKHIPGQVSQ